MKSSGSIRFPASVTRELGHYVYVYVHPETDQIIYVGKGVGNRAFAHLNGSNDAELAKVIRQLRLKGLKPRIDILVHGLQDEETAFRVEAAAIDLIGVDKLTNAVRGWGSVSCGRRRVEDIIAAYKRTPVTIAEPSILIRINQLYRSGMSEIELYDATRGVWVVGKQREKAKYAFAVFGGIIQEVYRIRLWLPAGATLSSRGNLRTKGRWEFVGTLAERSLRAKYIRKSVEHYFPRHSQNPVRYINCARLPE